MAKFSIIARIQHWMDSVPGQTFMNYAYSWGAAVVILGTLFKLTHIPGANAMLFIGMGTEVFVFFIAGFDRPFDAKVDNELADDYVDLNELEKLKQVAQAVVAPVGNADGSNVVVGQGSPIAAAAATTGGGGTIVIGGGAVGAATGAASSAADGSETAQPLPAGVPGAAAPAAGGTIIIGGSLPQGAPIDMAAAEATNPEEVAQAIDDYVEQLQQLSTVLAQVRERAEKLTGDNEEMLNLGRTLTGITTIYEMQLKSVSQQVGTIDQINEQTRLMAKQIEELNAVYASMIKALTVGRVNDLPQA